MEIVSFGSSHVDSINYSTHETHKEHLPIFSLGVLLNLNYLTTLSSHKAVAIDPQKLLQAFSRPTLIIISCDLCKQLIVLFTEL